MLTKQLQRWKAVVSGAFYLFKDLQSSKYKALKSEIFMVSGNLFLDIYLLKTFYGSKKNLN